MSITAPWKPVSFSTVSGSVDHLWYLRTHIKINIYVFLNIIIFAFYPFWCKALEMIIFSFSLLFISWFICCQNFQFPITETPRHSIFFSGIICGPPWGSFAVLGSFAVQFGDHLRSGIVCGLGIIYGAVQLLYYALWLVPRRSPPAHSTRLGAKWCQEMTSRIFASIRVSEKRTPGF